MQHQTVPETIVDLSHKGVDNILAALAGAGLEVHYNETDGDTFLDVWLTDLDADNPMILSWRATEGWLLKSWATSDTAAKPAQSWSVIAGDLAGLASEAAALISDGEIQPTERIPDPLAFALDEVLATVNGVDPIERDAEYEDCSAEELHIHKQLGRIRSLISQMSGANNLIPEAVEAVIADREAQASSPEVANAVGFTLEMELRPWFGPRAIPEEHLRRVAARLMGRAAWIRPAAPGCDCSATGGQGLVPTASREHADDCPAVAR